MLTGGNKLHSLRRLAERPYLLVALLVGAILVMSAVVSLRMDSLAEDAHASVPPVLVFIGDSYTQGTRYGGAGDLNYVQVLCAPRRWTCDNAALGGTGYVNAGGGALPYELAQIGAVVSNRPDVVVIAGSRNDEHVEAQQLEVAAVHLYRSVRAAAPEAKLMVVGPMWSNSAPSADMLRARDAIAAAAQSENIHFVDPIAQEWLVGAGLIGPDGVHPTDAGHAVLADRIGRALDALPVVAIAE